MGREHAHTLLHEALALTEAERAEFAAELLASLRPPGLSEDDAELRQEIERRADLVRTGASDGLAWEDVRARLRRS